MKRWILTPNLFSTSILSSCYRDSMQEEIKFYLQDMLADITDLEVKAKTAFERVTRDHYTTDQELYNTLIYDVIPVYYEFLTKLAHIKVDTPILQNIHENCLNGVNIQYHAFIHIATALEELDKRKLEEANAMLVHAGRLIACPI